jgi:hypothetical protein
MDEPEVTLETGTNRSDHGPTKILKRSPNNLPRTVEDAPIVIVDKKMVVVFESFTFNDTLALPKMLNS